MPITLQQIIGAAYTYPMSKAVRKAKTTGLGTHHSSQHQEFSYFFKGPWENVAEQDEALIMRTELSTNRLAQHWPEPELAVLLDEKHRIAAYTLANDLTAHSLEFQGRTHDFDGTFYGKVWKGSCGIGPEWVWPKRFAAAGELSIGLRIIRGGMIIYDHAYGASRRKWSITKIAEMIVDYSKKVKDPVPPSKAIAISHDGYLVPGTIILLGTGLIVREEYYCRPGDVNIVYCKELNLELRNPLQAQQA